MCKVGFLLFQKYFSFRNSTALALNFFLTCQILTVNIFLSEHKSSKPHFNRRYSFEVCIHWESDIRWRVDILSANQECRSLLPEKRTQFQKSQGVDRKRFFSLPSSLAPSPIVFCFNLGSAFRAAVNSYFANHVRKKHTKKTTSCAGCD